MPKKFALLFLTLLICLQVPSLLAQRNRIAGRIDNSRRVALRGHVHPKAVPADDQGLTDPSFVLPNLTLMLKPSDAQQAALDQLLAEQQDPASPNFHHWLTPEQFADRFGASQDDLDRIVAWLQAQQLTVTGVARGRNWITAQGTAATVKAAFATEIHRYRVNGELHFGNASEPSIPAAFLGIVQAVHGLHDFRLKPALRSLTPVPDYTSTSGHHYLAPDDLAVIYNIKPLHSSGITGSGQKIVVVGQTDLDLADVRQFRTYFNLPANDPQIVLVPNSPDPGTSKADAGEANLDLQWAGAVARDAQLIYVNSTDVMNSVQYAINQNLAPVISMSYGLCEAETLTSDAATIQALAKQGNAQGITWVNASGDSGATDCYGGSSRFKNVQSVDFPASVPEITGIGGLTFNEGSGTYWNTSGDANHASALGYIPETAWNDTPLRGTPSSGGGGASTLYLKPSWQSGTGVPNDGARDVPDVALSASPDTDGYLVYVNGSMQVFGGTSAGTPAFAGLAALLNQYLVSSGFQSSAGLGNINPKLYSLARSTPAAFHDVTAGNNIINVTCSALSRNCTPGPIGFNAGVGYDQATGLGSVDAFALATAWRGGSAPPAVVPGSPMITGLVNAASYTQSLAPGTVLSVFGTQLSPATQTAGVLPLPAQLAGVSVTINGVTAPLYYVSSGQLNVQIPYETATNNVAVLRVNNNGQSTTAPVMISPAAPAIFMDSKGGPVPSASGARNQVMTLYITGYGAVTPPLSTGAGPATGIPLTALPAPVQTPTVTVGKVAAPILFAGVPWGFVGVMQINYQIPPTAPLGAQPVVVTIGGSASTPATLTVAP